MVTEGFFGRFLTGKYPLAATFWLGGAALIVVIPVTTGLVFLCVILLLAKIVPLAARLFGLIAGCATATSIVVLWAVASWRSATRSTSVDAPSHWPVLAKLVVSIGVFFELLMSYPTLRPIFQDAVWEAQGDPEWGVGKVTVYDGGAACEVEGHITQPLVDRLTDELDKHPHILTVALSSVGGRVKPALRLRDLIATRHLDTVVRTECSSACTIAFLGGARRLISTDARIGFHAAISLGEPSADADAILEKQAIAIGVEPEFAKKAYSNTIDVWYPSTRELIDAKFATGIYRKTKSRLERT